MLGERTAACRRRCHDARAVLVSRFHVKPMVKRPTAMLRETLQTSPIVEAVISSC